MDKFLQSFSNKKVRYGSFSTLIAAVFVAVLLIINLVFSQLNFSMDLTKDKIYSITQETKDALKDISSPVTVYALFKTGSSDSYSDVYKELLDEYPKANRNIKVEEKDPYLYPQFVEKYAKEGEEIPIGSIIVESGDKYKVINKDQLISVGFDQNTFQQYVKSVDIEPVVTNAIRFVTSGVSNTMYIVNNHSEQALSDAMMSKIALANFEVKNLDLMMSETVPEDCDLLFVTTPAKDWSAVEAETVKKYLQSDGRAAFVVDFTGYELKNLFSVLEGYGVGFGDGIVVESSYKNMYMGNAVFIIPEYKEHDISQNLLDKKYNTILTAAMPINNLSLKKNSTTIESVMVSTSDSYLKGMDSKSVNKEPGDKSGPFNLAVAITDTFYTDKQHTSKIFVVGTSAVISSELDAYSSGNNVDFVINGLKWTQDKVSDIYISPKTTTSDTISMDFSQGVTIIIFSVIVIPLAIIITGIVVWLRRRNS